MTDYYTCRDCGGFTMTCGCSARRATERRSEWARKANEARAADNRVRGFLDRTNMNLADREAITLILQLAQRQIAAIEGFAKAPQ